MTNKVKFVHIAIFETRVTKFFIEVLKNSHNEQIKHCPSEFFLRCNAYKIYKTYTSEKSLNMKVSISGVTVFSYDRCNLLISVQISLGNAFVCIMGYV